MRSLTISSILIAAFVLICDQAEASDKIDGLFRKSVMNMQAISTNLGQFPGKTFTLTDGGLKSVDVANDGTIFGTIWDRIYKRDYIPKAWSQF
jgi:hypothetical protein